MLLDYGLQNYQGFNIKFLSSLKNHHSIYRPLFAKGIKCNKALKKVIKNIQKWVPNSECASLSNEIYQSEPCDLSLFDAVICEMSYSWP